MGYSIERRSDLPPTVRLADLVGTERGGAGSVELTAATAFTVRLAAAVHGIMMGGAAAPGRPPPAVLPRHRATGEVRKGRWILKGTLLSK